MYRSFLSILFVLAVATALSAQSSSATQSGSTAQTHAQTHDKSATLTGCLSGPNDEGAYMLKNGRHSVEVGGSDELKAHVGHEVKLSGSWARSGSAIGEREENESAEHNHKAATSEAGEKAEANTSGARGAGEHHGKSEAHERHFKVSSVTMVADTCTSTAKK